MIPRYCIKASRCSYGKTHNPCDLHEDCPAFRVDMEKSVEAIKENKKPPKYRNKIIKTEEGTFKSQWEYDRWCQLKLLQRAGAISDLQKQVKFVLVEKSKGHREMSYYADFTYYEDGKYIVEDTKSNPTKTSLYKAKKKLMYDRYGIEIRETEK